MIDDSSYEDNYLKVRNAYPELFDKAVEERHNLIVKKNPDLHKGHAVAFDGRCYTGHTTYPEFNLHNFTDLVRYLPVDEIEDIENDPQITRSFHRYWDTMFTNTITMIHICILKEL